ncbi:MAG: hypothetical protein HKN00_08595 [Flavobacteriaceae bacterium]|nr:hypothetical protein [Bacteroidia bacterium]MBT8287260.1 hypothetical protein [Bacteroidia bacterium]NNF75226.1 hypothetical protein [Flavobacteriaceae bacterium]NNK73846.1 hypothetical protein [Flavobacteriaceae bacterium]
MKKLILLFVILVTWNCTTDDAPINQISFEILPIRSVIDMPETVNFNDVYTIHYTYVLPTTCHSFNDLYYLTEGEVRTVAVISQVINETETIICESLPEEEIQGTFTFHVLNNAGTYIFKFWQGINENGVDQYLVYEVPIQ